jgi:hypothetical protein
MNVLHGSLAEYNIHSWLYYTPGNEPLEKNEPKEE